MIPLPNINLTRATQTVNLAIDSNIYDRLVLLNQSQDLLDISAGIETIRLQAQQANWIRLASQFLVINPTLNTTANPTPYQLQVFAVEKGEVLGPYPQIVLTGPQAATGTASFDTGTLANNARATIIPAPANNQKTTTVTFMHVGPNAQAIGFYWVLETDIAQRNMARLADTVVGDPITTPFPGGLSGDQGDAIDLSNQSGASGRVAGVLAFQQ